ncbi:polycomb group protein Psc-like isoform X1 [Hermetia illucens]|nr:polycomb group protein Psc-like isoform X1 [Hermetia illucens]
MPPLPGVLAMLSPSQSVSKSFSSAVASSSGPSYTAEMSAARTDLVATNRLSNDNKVNQTSPIALAMTTSTLPSSSTASMMPSKSNTANSSNLNSAATPTGGSITNESSSSCSESHSTSVSDNSKASSSSDSSSDSKSSCNSDSTKAKENENGSSANNETCDTKDNENALVESSGTNSADADSDLSSSSMFGRPRQILLKNVNAHITCSLCTGYLIDATTIVECLHSFCHSCIMNYLRKDQYCPRCEMMINTTKHNNIKLDTTLQAIVYKLVPGLYEKELLRKRAFYSTRPEEAKLATPEQRGDDTEHLIFGPTDNMSLSLEYADIEELADEDASDLRKPKYLQCPANFTVAHLKKFVFGKYGIDQSRFTMDIMYKVKTIVLADHYKMMDVAYIYTWKRDAPMKFFFRVKELENPPRKKKCPKILPKAIKENCLESKETDNKQSSSVEVEGIKDEKEIKVEIKEEQVIQDTIESEMDIDIPTIVPNSSEAGSLLGDCMVAVPIAVKTPPSTSPEKPEIKREEDIFKEESNHVPPVSQFTPESKVGAAEQTFSPKNNSDKTNTDHRPEKLKITLVNKGKNSGKEDDAPKGKSSLKNKSSKHSPPELEDRKVENIKLKIDLSKQGSVTIINMSSPDSGKKEVVKPLKPEKEWKIKIKKDKDKQTNGTSDKNKSSPHEKTVPPITIELGKSDSRNSGASYSSKFENDEDKKKSEFLNSIDLTPIKSITSPNKADKHKSTVGKSLSNSLTPSFSLKKPLMPPPPPPPAPKTSSASKRKSKEPVKAIVKKPRLDSPAFKLPPQPQIKVRSNLLEPKKSPPGITFKLAPFPFGANSEVAKHLETSTTSTLVAPLAPKSESDTERKLEDEKLMPAPPPLKMLDVFKRNGMKPTKSTAKSKIAPTKPGKTTSSDGFLRPIVTTSMAQNSRVPIVSNIMGNRTPIARRYAPILPKSGRTNPFANLPSDVGFLPNNSTEIKPIQNGENKEIKVYGPPAATTSSPAQKPTVSIATSVSSMNQRPTSKSSASGNYLNYALFNSTKSKMGEVPLGCRTPIYTPNSPIYSPNSPQYMPNYNIPSQPVYKYTKTQSSATNYLQNILGTNKQLSSLFPAPPVKKSSDQASSKTEGSEKALKRNKTPPIVGKMSPEPSDKQTPVQSLLNSCNINIPSSLSITIRNEDDDADSTKSSNMKHSNPVNNYIEILKLPDTPLVTNDAPKIASPNHSDVKTMMQPKSPTSLKLPGVTINPSKVSPPAMSASPTVKPGVSSPNSAPKAKSPASFDSDKRSSPSSVPHKNAKKTPSPEKKTNEKSSRKAEKRPASDLAKSPKEKYEISSSALKKFRPILPRSKTPPVPGVGPVTSLTPLPTKMVPKLSTSKSGAIKSKKGSPKTANQVKSQQNSGAKTPDSFVDLTNQRKTATPPGSLSLITNPPAAQPGNLPPELTAFLAQQRQLQQQQQQQGPFSPIGATNAANFLPHLASFHPATNLNMQRAYLMEHLARMQKAGVEALEKYMQQQKNNNTNCVKSPSTSPGNNGTGAVSTSSPNNVKNST